MESNNGDPGDIQREAFSDAEAEAIARRLLERTQGRVYSGDEIRIVEAVHALRDVVRKNSNPEQ